MLNPMQMINMMMGSGDPMQMLQQTFGQNPNFQRAMQMAQGKSPQQLQQIVSNLAQQRGMSMQELQQMAGQMGIRF